MEWKGVTMHPTRQLDVHTRKEPAFWFLGALTLVKSTGESTNGAFGLIEQLIPAGFASPYHIHHLEDEAFYVLEGEVMFVRDGKWLKARSPATWSSVTERANLDRKSVV